METSILCNRRRLSNKTHVLSWRKSADAVKLWKCPLWVVLYIARGIFSIWGRKVTLLLECMRRRRWQCHHQMRRRRGWVSDDGGLFVTPCVCTRKRSERGRARFLKEPRRDIFLWALGTRFWNDFSSSIYCATFALILRAAHAVTQHMRRLQTILEWVVWIAQGWFLSASAQLSIKVSIKLWQILWNFNFMVKISLEK